MSESKEVAATVGQVVKITSQDTGTCRLCVDIPKERVPGTVWQWFGLMVAVAVLEPEAAEQIEPEKQVVKRTGKSTKAKRRG